MRRGTTDQGSRHDSGEAAAVHARARLMVVQDKLRARRLSAGATQGLGRECDRK